MCLVSKVLLEQYRFYIGIERLSVLDLKILFNVRHTAKTLFKLTHMQPDSILINTSVTTLFLMTSLTLLKMAPIL